MGIIEIVLMTAFSPTDRTAQHKSASGKKRVLLANPWLWPSLIAASFAGIAFNLGALESIDRSFIHQIKLIPHGLKPAMIAVTTIASVQNTLALFAISVLVFIGARQWRAAGILLVSITAMPLFGILKFLVHRARPDHAIAVKYNFHNDSFPSGHATASFIVFVTLIYVLRPYLSTLWIRIAGILAGTIIVTIGISRVYLGFHFPSDVVAGWLVAAFVFVIVRQLNEATGNRKRVLRLFEDRYIGGE